MFKILTALIAVASLSLAAFALAPAADTRDDVLLFSARLTGLKARGAAFYEEYPATVKVTQVLTVRLAGAEPGMEYKVGVQGYYLGLLRTDTDGNGFVRYTNPPVPLPRIRAGTVITVGEAVGRFIQSK